MVGDAGEQVKRTDMTRDSKETMRHGERTKSTQTTRSLPARTAGAKRATNAVAHTGLSAGGKVLALLLAAALLATMAIAGGYVNLENKAYARNPNVIEDGALCTPSTGVIGDSNGIKKNDDDGIATWVGRDMYIGAPVENINTYNQQQAIGASYAVEAEGLTVVNGKLAMRGVKGKKVGKEDNKGVDNANFNGHGFRFGTVGFGANFRPARGSDVLVVAGKNTAIDLWDYSSHSKKVNVLAWGNAARGYVRAEGKWDDHGNLVVQPQPNYSVRIQSDDSHVSRAHWMDYEDNYDNLENSISGDSIFNFDDDWRNGEYANWHSQINWVNASNVLESVKVNSDRNTIPLTETQISIENLSDVLNQRPALNDITNDADPHLQKTDVGQVQQGFLRNNYGSANYKVTFDFGVTADTNERVITFTGNGTMKEDTVNASTGAYEVTGGSTMQVFDLPASWLDNGGSNGVSFRFDNIPEHASVVVNVVGENTLPGGKKGITFNNGWRFWWNGEEISNYYTTFTSNEINEAEKQRRNERYSHAASALMWNFGDVQNGSKVTIHGGQIKPNQNGQVTNVRSSDKAQHTTMVGNDDIPVTDDPVANMLGSILVPHGSLETHVSTNGRVWVGEDYMMNNPTGQPKLAWLNQFTTGSDDNNNKQYHEPISASVVEQDQERHNFGWHGEVSTECAVLEWQKVDERGTRLNGSEWAIYGTKEGAENHGTTHAQDPLITVKDDGREDWAIGDSTNPAAGHGKFQVRRLKPNAKYFLREISAPQGYELNTNIYEIHTGAGTQNQGNIDSVVNGGFTKPSTTIYAVYTNAGSAELLWTDPNDNTGNSKGVINLTLPSVEWEKVDSETGALLGGSEWRLYKKQVEDHNTSYPVIKEIITDAYGTMVYLDTKTAGWPADGGVAETPKIHYKIGNRGDWTVSEMTPYGNGIYGVYVPGRGQNVKFSFFLGTVSCKISEYRPNGSADNFSSGANVQYVTVRSKNQAVEPTQPTTSSQGPEYTDLDMRQGKFKLGGLTEGEYTLQETKAPEGYWLPEAASSGQPDPRYYTFTVSLNNGKYEISWNSSTIKIGDDEITTTGASTVSGSSVGRISNTPTGVSWWKIDADDKDSNDNVKNTVLAGSEWQLQKWSLKDNSTTEYEYRTFKDDVVDCVVTEGDSPTCANDSVDQNPEPGKFTLKRLPVGKYRLKETKAPLGYVLPADEYIYFEITNTESGTNDVQWKQGWSDVDGSGNPTNLTQGNKAPINVNKVSDSESAHAVGNTRKPGEVTWEKIAQKPQRQHKQGQVDDPDTPVALSEAENHQLLAGSEWKFEYTPYQAASGTQPTTLTIKDCMPADNGSGDVNCTAINDSYSWAVDVEETAGKFKISGMPWGDYVLTEAKAPDGYNLDATPHKFSIGVKTSEDGSTVVGTVGTGGAVTEYPTSSVTDKQVISINLGEIENEPGVVLPVTGAEGRHLWPAIVGALFVLAAFGCAVALRMRE